MRKRVLFFVAAMLHSVSASAHNIVLTNDDGLTSNVKALYDVLKAQGHDVIVSVPCTNQSGMGTSIRFMKPIGNLTADCRNGAAEAGDAGVGPMRRSDLGSDFFYVDGTPVMAMLYGIDVIAAKRWGRAPDLILSGPNEGQNVGNLTFTSGTVSNAEFATLRGIPAIAASAAFVAVDDPQLGRPEAREVAKRLAELVERLDRSAGDSAILPPRTYLNVNFPEKLNRAKWRLSRHGTFNSHDIRFVTDLSTTEFAAARGVVQPLPGVTAEPRSARPTAAQQTDEAVVYRTDIAISIMQVDYDSRQRDRLAIAQRLQTLVH